VVGCSGASGEGLQPMIPALARSIELITVVKYGPMPARWRGQPSRAHGAA
jgi:hypothetical protein